MSMRVENSKNYVAHAAEALLVLRLLGVENVTKRGTTEYLREKKSATNVLEIFQKGVFLDIE